MSKKLRTKSGESFVFRVYGGHLLADRIGSIEASATQNIKDGTPYESVQIGALALLKIAMEGVSAALV